MIVCPVCENQQPSGDECSVCGKQLTAAKGATVAPVAPLAELEVTQHTGPQNVVAQPIEGLEVTRIPSPAQVAPESVEGLEHTEVVLRNLQVIVDRVADLELGREVDDGVRTAAPTGAVTCRYCQNVQAEGLICNRCGMRLPKARIEAEAVAGSPNPKKEPVWTRCKRCGAPAKAEEPCRDCGTFVPLPDNA
ncbi:MAG: hypothetical protein ACJ790_01505 [Myxococcaceae bacterium]